MSSRANDILAAARIQRIIDDHGRYLHVKHTPDHRSVEIEDYWQRDLDRIVRVGIVVSAAEARALAAALLRAADAAAPEEILVEEPVHVALADDATVWVFGAPRGTGGEWLELPPLPDPPDAGDSVALAVCGSNITHSGETFTCVLAEGHRGSHVGGGRVW